MSKVLLTFGILFISICSTKENEYSVWENGWVPILDEVIPKRIRNDIMQSTHYEPDTKYVWDRTSSESEQNMQILRNNAIKLVQPEYLDVIENHETDVSKSLQQVRTSIDKPAGIRDEYSEHDGEKNQNDSKDSGNSKMPRFNVINSMHIRKPKAIKQYVLQKSGNNVPLNNNNIQGEDNEIYSMKEKPSIANEDNEEKLKNSYAVTEDMESFGSVSERTVGAESPEYFYRSPELTKNYNDKNLTEVFLNILNKYNVKPEGHPPNYALSRSRNSQNTLMQSYLYMPIPMTIFHRHNSLNHLPLDPLIAVFLSNYGYYLPGVYGRHGNYRNLYGYLASNNIHNNLPFGLYKIFSDTDSSN